MYYYTQSNNRTTHLHIQVRCYGDGVCLLQAAVTTQNTNCMCVELDFLDPGSEVVLQSVYSV